VDITLRKLPGSTDSRPLRETEVTPHMLLEALAGPGEEIGNAKFGFSAASEFLLKFLSAAISTPAGRGKAVKLIIPRVPGYIVRSDIIPLRMIDCPHVLSVVSFSEPQQWFPGDSQTNGTTERLGDVFAASAAGILLDTNEAMADMASDLDALEVELRNRLSFPWLLKERRPRQTLAMVRGALRSPEYGGTGSNIYSAAKVLGIDVVVLDSPGHWLESPEYAGLCESFLPINIERDAELPTRIVDALSKYGKKIDGIITYLESYAALVARAAEHLSLPTAPPESFEIATDKYKTSVVEGHTAYHASSADEALYIACQPGLKYPLIVKPCRGWSSEGVSKAEDASGIANAIKTIDVNRHGARFVIEEYCDGPEVDANLILCDGELLLFEVSDDFPKSGDGNNVGSVSSFIELANVLPSKLPSSELNMLRDSLCQSLLRLGFQSGVYHLEARVKDSEMEYVVKDDIMDLEYRPTPSKAVPSSWLIEINPRPPGIQASDAVESTYGVDYVGLGLLFPLNDKERAKALSHPFANGPQYWCEMVFIPVEKGGTFNSGDVCDELKERRPDLAQHISKSVCFFKKGEAVPSPSSGHNAWVAYFNVFSRVGRAHVLEIAESIRHDIRFLVI
jgi:biotin carboxylase